MVDTKINIDIDSKENVTENIKKAEKETKKLNNSIEETESAFSKLFNTINNVVAGTASAITGISTLVIAGLYGAGKALETSLETPIKKWEEFQDQILRTNATLTGSFSSIRLTENQLESFSDTILELSKNTGIARTEFADIGKKVYAFSSTLGLNKNQAQDLLKTITALSQLTGDSLSTVFTNVSSSINTSTNALANYGIAINDNLIKQEALKTITAEQFENLSETTKAQLRFNILTASQNKIIESANGIKKSNLQILREEENVWKLVNEEIGRGANYLTDIGSISAEIYKVIPPIILNLGGFFTALMAKILKLTAAFAALRLAMLAIDFLKSGGLTAVPYYFDTITKAIKLNEVSFKSWADFATTSTRSVGLLITQLAFSMNASGKNLSFLDMTLKAITTTITSAIAGFLSLGKVLLAFISNPIVLTILAISAALYGLYKLFALIEERTGFFSKTWDIFVWAFVNSWSIFDPVIKAFKDGWNGLVDFLDMMAGKIIKWTSKFLKILTYITIGSSVFAAETTQKLQKVNDDVSSFVKDLEKNEDRISRVAKKVEKVKIAPTVSAEYLKELKDKVLEIERQFENSKNDTVKGLTSVFNEKKKILLDAFNLGQIVDSAGKKDFERYQKILSNLKTQFNKDLNKLNVDTISKDVAIKDKQYALQIEQYDKLISAASTYSEKKALEEKKGQLETQREENKLREYAVTEDKKTYGLRLEIFQKNIEDRKKSLMKFFREVGPMVLDKLGSIVDAIGNGAEGAKQLLSAIPGVIGSIWGPIGTAIGGFIGKLISVLSMTKETLRERIREFMNALPEIVQRISENVPVFVQAIADNLPLVTRAAIASMPAIARSFFDAILKEGPKLAAVMISDFIASIPLMVETFTNYLMSGKFFEDIGRAIAEGFISSVKSVGNIFGSIGKSVLGGDSILGKVGGTIGGAVSGVVGGIGNVLGFANGGEIPAGYPNDNFFMRASTGENVIDRSTNTELKKFLSDQTLLQEILKELKKPINVETSVQLNNREFASVIFQLNRSNARLA